MNMQSLDKFLKSGAMLVILIPALGYLVGYANEFTYLKHFEVNYMAIEINPPMLVVNILAVMLLIICLAALYDVLIRRISIIYTKLSLLIRYNIEVMLFWLTIVALMWSVGSNINYVSYTLLTLVAANILLCGYLVVVGVRYRSVKRAYQILRLQDLSAKTQKKRQLTSFARLFVIGIAAILLSLVTGKFRALVQNNFPVISQDGDKKTVVIQQYGNRLIYKTYDTKYGKFMPGYSQAELTDRIDFKDTLTIER